MKRWRSRSGPAKVDLYTRGTVYSFVWLSVLVVGGLLLTRPVRSDGPAALVLATALVDVANGVLCHRLARRAMDTYLRRGEVTPRDVVPAAVTTAALAAGVTTLATTVDLTGFIPLLLGSVLVPFFSGHCLIVRPRIIALHQAGTLAVLAALLPLTGRPLHVVVVTTVTVGFLTGWLAFAVRVSLWVLGVMWELREARDVQARLAVAEERLRFGRDLHDVLGRNLAVIALKSELAVQLVRRGRPEAVDQMTEVQRIAQESQREVREVVRGYRDADLRAELEGARGVLEAAGIMCTIEAGDAGLPVQVQSALGWVVREATTNVLRHGDAQHCTISVRATDGAAVLVVENDGAGQVPADTGGSGLTGLRERLSAVDGALEAGPCDGGRFRLTARVPLKPEPEPELPSEPEPQPVEDMREAV
ncbi:sensor histidine kinase [Streptomyces sp. NPDC002187]|uniref:sensor histidine kinase n=1 Tax=Streptomyces sp. NPDC002187 TaxID=3364637 RepID=UPI0036B8B3BC